VPEDDVESWLDDAQQTVRRAGVKGKELTPFLLSALAELSQGATLAANKALLENNAVVACEIAQALSSR
jgi:pseudouridine-5'-phosphate glycosidase